MKTLPLPEVAELLGVSTRTVECWISTGELKAINVSRNPKSRKPRLRVLESDLQAFMLLRRTGNESRSERRQRPKLPVVPSYV